MKQRFVRTLEDTRVTLASRLNSDECDNLCFFSLLLPLSPHPHISLSHLHVAVYITSTLYTNYQIL
jgi:hypothetical protein